MKKEAEESIAVIALKLCFFYWVTVAVIALFLSGCTAPKERRGDWMEHLNDKQFTYNAPTISWDRHNYYSKEELRQMWDSVYKEAIANLNNKEE